MHGRPRPPKDFQPPPEVVSALARKTKLLKTATSEVLKRRRELDYSAEGLVLSAKLLALNPEVYTAWNYRREAVLRVFDDDSKSVDEKREVSEKELHVSAEALKRNPKSYSAWHQRKWVLAKGFCVPKHEFNFVEARLDEDERNFHAWNYRQFLVEFSGRSPQEELEYSKKKIEQNFSNFSAWHYRTKFLPLAYQIPETRTLSDLMEPGPQEKSSAKRTPIPLNVLDEEYEIVHSAFATDCEDSSAWFYYRWLLKQSVIHWKICEVSKDTENSPKTILRIVERETSWLKQDILSLEPNAKWPCLAIAWLNEIKAHCLEEEKVDQGMNMKDNLELLASVDGQRRGFYEDTLKGQTSLVV